MHRAMRMPRNMEVLKEAKKMPTPVMREETEIGWPLNLVRVLNHEIQHAIS